MKPHAFKIEHELAKNTYEYANNEVLILTLEKLSSGELILRRNFYGVKFPTEKFPSAAYSYMETFFSCRTCTSSI